MELLIILFASGAVLALWVYLWVRQRERLGAIPPVTRDFEAASEAEDAILVAQPGGRLIYINALARAWAGIAGGDPDLETIARLTQPSDAFRELFAGAGRASFQLNGRWVEGVSHRVPAGAETRIVVMLRPLANSGAKDMRAASEMTAAGESRGAGLDLGGAMAIVNEMGETLNVTLGVERVMSALLTIVRKVIKSDAGEICVYDEVNRVLIPRGWDGDAAYVVALVEQGGYYDLGEGVTGWIAQYRKPLLVADVRTDPVVRPKLKNNPYGSFIGVPLLLGDGRLIGTFELVSKQHGRFTVDDLTLLETIARPIATTIHNAELYARQSQRIEELASLQAAAASTVSDSPSTMIDTTALYTTLTERIARLMNASVCGILLHNPERGTLVAQLPFYGLPSGLVRSYAIPITGESPGADIFRRADYWISNDLADEPTLDALGMARLVNPGGVENTAIMPLTVSGRRIGVVQIGNKRAASGFSSVDMQQFRLLASQAAVAVEEVRLAQDQARRDAEMVGLQELAQAFGSVESEEEFLRATTERIARLLRVAYCGVLLYDETAHLLRPRLPFYGLSDEMVALYQIKLPPGSPIAQIWDESESWYTNNTSTDSVVLGAELADLALALGVTKTMIVVISVAGRRLGAIQISNKLDGDFSDEDVRLLSIFASQVGGMIENNRLFRETQRRAEQSELLRVLAERASRVLTSEDDMRPILAEVATLLNSPAVFVNVLDAQAGTLTTYSRYIYGIELAEAIIQNAYSKGFEYSVAISRRPFISNDVLNDLRVLPSYRDAAERLNIRAAVLVPLVVGDLTLGELGAMNRTDPPYNDDDRVLLSQIAIQVAGALDRIRLYEATGQNLRRRLAELDAINRVSNEVAQTLDVDHVVEVIRLEAVRATDAGGSTVVLLTPQDKWRAPDKPEVERRAGERRPHTGLADIEREAVIRALAGGIDAVIVEDYDLNAGIKSPGGGARAAIAVPILYEEQPVGAIHLYHPQPNHFDSRAATFLLTLAAKASLSYGNLQRYVENQARSDRLSRRVEQLNQIFELGQMLQTGVDPSTMLEAIAYSVQQSCGFDVVVMTLIDERMNVLRRVAHAGLPVETFERTRYRTMALDQLDTLFAKHDFVISETLFLPFEQLGNWYVEGMDALSPHFQGNRTMHSRGRNDWRDGDMLLVPITGPTGARLGVMSLDRPFDGNRPDRGVIEVLEIFAHQAAATIENTRLFTASMRTADQEARLNEIIESISNTLNPDAIVESGARGIARLLTFNRLTVALLDTESLGYNITRVTIQPDGTSLVGRDHRDSLDGTALGRAYRTGEDALYLADESGADEAHQNETPYRDYEDLYSLRVLGERTTLIMPLITGGFVLGAMHIGGDALDEENFNAFRPLLGRIANLLAVAIQNARLFNQAVNLRLFNESVVQSIQQGIIVVDMDGAILTINEYMRRRFKWDDAALNKRLFEYRPDYGAILADALGTVLQTGAPQEMIGRQVIENGERLIQNFYLYPLFSADAARGAVVLIEDVTYRALLESNLEQRARQLAALTEVSSRITASLRRDEVIALTIEEMAHIIPYDAISIWSREGGVLVCQAVNSPHLANADSHTMVDVRDLALPAVGARVEIDDDDQIMQLIGARRPLNVADVSGLTPSVMRGTTGSWLAVALIEERAVVGVIALSKRQTSGFDAYAEQGAQAFANQVAVALVNAALFEEAQSRTQRLSLLNRVSTALARSLDTENIFEVALQEIAQTLGLANGRAYIIERDIQVARAVVELPRGDAPPSQFVEILHSYPFRRLTGDVQPVIVYDVARADQMTEEGYAPPEALVGWTRQLREKQIASYVLLPMTVSGQVTGAFELEVCDTPHTFTDEKVDLALIIANQAGIAVMNSNLLEQTLVRTRELETLLEAAQATSNTLDLNEVFSSVIRLVLQALEMDDCAIMIYDNVQDTLIVQIDMNRQGEHSREMPRGTIFDLKRPSAKQAAIRNGQIIVVRADDPNADPTELAEMQANGDTARMLVPLIVREQTIGLLQIETRSRYRVFAHREIRMAQALGSQAATSIENARLSTETAAQVEQSMVINDLSRAVSSTMDISDMLRIVREQVPAMLDVETLYVALYNADSGDIVFPMAVQNGKDVSIPPRSMGADEVSFIIRHRRPLSLGGDNPSAEQVRKNLRIENGEGDALRYLGVPLIAGDQIVGVLGVRDSRKTRPFGLNDQRILSNIGTQLGAAIQNANLFEQVRTFADQMNLRVQDRTRELQEERDRIDALYRITSELGQTLDMDRLLRGALENVARVVGADDAVVMLTNPLTDRLYTRATLNPPPSNMPLERAPDGDHPFHPAEMLGDWLIRQDKDRMGERAALIDDLIMTPYWDISAPNASEYRSGIAVVLETQEDALGVMVFLGRDVGQFSEPQLKLVQAAASQVATAINNADLYSLIRDQAERMGTLLRVEQEEAGKNSAILEGIADGVLLADSTGTIILFNNAAERILDIPRDYALKQALRRLAPMSDGTARWVSALETWIAQHGISFGGSLVDDRGYPPPPRREDDSLVIDRVEVGGRVVSIRASSVFVGSQLLGTVAVFRDVTKEVEVDRMKSEFISNVTHELRTPLTPILGFVDLMLMGGAGDINEQTRRFLSMIKTNAERLRNLVEDLLSISELDSGRGKLDLESLDLEEQIMMVVSHLYTLFNGRGKVLEVETRIDPNTGSIQADRVKLNQIISNIIENAFNYTYNGGRVTIEAHRQPDGRHVLIVVSDTGIGIPEAFRERIWNRFERYEEHALVMDVAGTGLGLPIVKTLVELHGGEVWFDSEVNKGTTFYIRLPVQPPLLIGSDPLATLAGNPSLSAPVVIAAPTNGHARENANAEHKEG
jgi:GAF domain-containing protein/signal transduction histidine kinase